MFIHIIVGNCFQGSPLRDASNMHGWHGGWRGHFCLVQISTIPTVGWCRHCLDAQYQPAVFSLWRTSAPAHLVLYEVFFVVTEILVSCTLVWLSPTSCILDAEYRILAPGSRMDPDLDSIVQYPGPGLKVQNQWSQLNYHRFEGIEIQAGWGAWYAWRHCLQYFC